MNLAFYYHIPVHVENGKIKTPGYLGVFIDSLALEVDTLYLVMHQASITRIPECDYVLTQQNIVWVNIGIAKPAWHRTFFPASTLKGKLNEIKNCDAFLVRSPSPLSPFFKKYAPYTRIFFLIVGDYMAGSARYKNGTWRDKIIFLYLNYFNKKYINQIRQTDCLVNSESLLESYKPIAKSISFVRTTTLTSTDYYKREDTCINPQKINILYTGRIEPSKGLHDMLKALSILNKKHNNIFYFHIVGWESDGTKPHEQFLKKEAQTLECETHLIFHGKKTLGEELNTMYRHSDIYVLSSHHEGFPRTIWEAMANSLPVVATKVGGIPTTLTHLQNAYLIEPQKIEEIVTAIEKIASDTEFRKSLITNAYELAKENHITTQTKKLILQIQEKL
ncbi:MAG: glycosyltransferase [Chitinophagaceae bacterium]